MKKHVLIPALLIGTLLTGSLAFAAPGFGKFSNCNGANRGQGAITFEQHEAKMELRLEKMTAVLDLTEAQQARIKELLNQNWQQRQNDRESMRNARDAMRTARLADPFDEADFRTKATKLNELKTERKIDRVKQQAEIYALLTPEQQKKAETVRGLMAGPGKTKGHHDRKGYCL